MTTLGIIIISQVYLSHHNQRVKNMKCPSNMVQKVDIKEVMENGVVFQDGSYEQVDTILYCTGTKQHDRGYCVRTHIHTHKLLYKQLNN